MTTNPLLEPSPDEHLVSVNPDARLADDPTPEESLIADAYAAAEQSNRPAELTAAKFLDQNVLRAYSERLAEVYPTQFAGTWYDSDTFHIRFKDGVPTDAVDALPADLELFDVEFHPNTGHSLTEAVATQEDMTDELGRQGVTGWFVSYDPVDAQVEVLLAPDTNRRALMRSTATQTSDVPVEVSSGVQETTVDFQVARGGGRMGNVDTGAPLHFRFLHDPIPVRHRDRARHDDCRALPFLRPRTWQYANPGESFINANRIGWGLGGHGSGYMPTTA